MAEGLDGGGTGRAGCGEVRSCDQRAVHRYIFYFVTKDLKHKQSIKRVQLVPEPGWRRETFEQDAVESEVVTSY
ncbi:MAG: hypothetical protein HOE90_21385 [Bacteriovoracaceae bacterium]|nr:hypothetical protein [Bacteriovoracaceae bacterium]